MSKRDFLLEIGLEELPARFVSDGEKQLADKVESFLKEQRISFEQISSFSTPRRLAVLVIGLAEKQADVEEESRGPAKKIALDESGNWTKAAQGFARGQGVSVDDLYIQEVKGTEYIFAKKFVAGQETASLLPELKELITSLHFPKNMRWHTYSLRYARPIQWLVALYGQEVIPFEITGVAAGLETAGHRFLGENVTIDEPTLYKEKLLQQYVMADSEERKKAIRHQIQSIMEEKDWVIPIDEDLLDEVTNLVEYPTALFGRFDEAFLSLPNEVLITSMREHQRYFPVKNQAGELLPYFVTIRNGDHRHLENVVKGNEKVLRARLSDAAFFYGEDQKLNIDEANKRLDQIVYHEELGSIGDKVKRVKVLAASIAEKLGVTSQTLQAINRVAEICKFDLVTQMVGEFPELQGRMGEVYAEIAGEPPEVAKGIVEHYLPRFAGDQSPSSVQGTVVSLADKLDTIAACFGIGLIPTGSQDPYALRRQAAGVVQILLDHELDLDVDELLLETVEQLQEKELLTVPESEVVKQLREFFALRVKTKLQDEGVRYDLTDAVLASGISNVPVVFKKAKLLVSKVNTPEFKELVEGLSRVTNIAGKAEKNVAINPDLFEKEEERVLYEAYVQTKDLVQGALASGDVSAAYAALEQTIEPIHQYFEHVMVMVDEQVIKENRLALMHAFAGVIGSYANFQEIVFK
ncbi:glycine--tRNA ligase subunit beta [Halalkalibacterium halodurans]|uniref:Glycine--tRNA ligase beta subunit n=1 Tax=Halalkalibacterium halodurans TaxID=86665 RepID=A0A0M0KL48_ALKHA|nr:glycine--tRNA ligase subunit beta [Halalkalibacterium halodurans]TES56666.1 glycine--tRNA ligase subunit beta [Halalkalibacterium halodurans]TPE69108.1 glycine--tRNA ligase subunit beta [Halalkalibacterium halodurans]